MKKVVICTIMFILISIIPYSNAFAYGTQVMDLQDRTFAWTFLEEPGVAIVLASRCSSNLFQNYMISGNYIGFHECSQFAKQDIFENNPLGYSQFTYAGNVRNYYKGSTKIGSTTMSRFYDVIASPDWIWMDFEGNTDGDVIGNGSGTYYAKSGSTFECPEAFLVLSHSIDNSVSIEVP